MSQNSRTQEHKSTSAQGKILVTCALVFLCSLVGCKTTEFIYRSSVDDNAAVWLNQTGAIEVVAAYEGDQKLYIYFRVFLKDRDQTKDFYGVSSWLEYLEIEEEGWYEDSQLEIIDKKEFTESVVSLNELVVLGSVHWENFRRELIHRIAPKEKETATVTMYDGRDQAVYYGEDDQLIISDIAEKPISIKIGRMLGAEEMTNYTLEVLQSYLNDLEIENETMLIIKGNNGTAWSPFVYVDRSRRLAINIKTDRHLERYSGNKFLSGTKAADQLLWKGHIWGVLKRPFSSAFRLLSWGKGAAYDIVRPKKLMFIAQSPLPPVNTSEGMDLKEWEGKLDRLIKEKAYEGTIDFLIGGEEFFPRFIEAISAAQKSIDIRIFIFDNDDYGVRMADILKKKSNEGIKVRVLLDGMGVVMGEEEVSKTIPAGYVPPRSMISYLQKNSKIKVRVRPNVWFKADHTKTLTIDNKISFTGGMNIGREYRYDWHDLMMEVNGPIVSEIIRQFSIAWDHAGKLGDLAYIQNMIRPKPVDVVEGGGYSIRPVLTKVNDPQIFKAQIEAIRNSRKYIYIHNSYFSDNTILYELIMARRRGVDVRVILPIKGNHEIMNKSNIVTANIMFKHGIRVYFYPSMTHIKAGVYDGWLCTGSANFDKLSFRDNLEFNLATSDPRAVNILLERLFEKDFKKSKEMKSLIKQSFKDRIAEFFAEQL